MNRNQIKASSAIGLLLAGISLDEYASAHPGFGDGLDHQAPAVLSVPASGVSVTLSNGVMISTPPKSAIDDPLTGGAVATHYVYPGARYGLSD